AMDQISRLLAEERTSLTALGRVCTLEGKLQLKSEAQHFVSVCNTLLGKYRELSQLLKLDFTAFLGQSAEETPFEKWKQRLDECATARDRISEIATCNSAARNCADAGLENFLRWTVEHNDVSPECWPNVFYRQFLLNWIFAHFSELPEFREFQQLDHQALIERFREADKHWLKMSQQRLATSVAARRPQMSNSTVKTSRLGVLKAEMRRKRGLKPIRQLFSLVGDAVQALKPCFMMSPISVAQYLQPGNMEFDVVIFDEASQVEPADALGAVARGRQLILVGDEKQLPPTNFFETVSIPDETTPDDDRPDTGDLESVLAQGIVMFPNPKALRWHYRSKHNSLIEFSNDEFYNHDLRVFPSPEFRTGDVGLSFRLIANGVYLRGKGQYNEVEAHAVAECVIEHARTFPKKSLGVGAFSAAQQRAIQDAVEQLRRDADDSQLEEFFGRDTDEPFFVKNLETIQGDERDVILLSVGYGPDNDGKITMNFGPINKDTGWRRLNVLVTRAKERCVVFSSLTSDQMHSDSASPRGVQALKRYLYFAQHGKLPTVGGNSGEHDSPFERDVATALREHNWEVDAQIGSAGFFIDLAVVDPRAPGRYLLGVECDGATYHRAATARDRDRLRQAVLEGLGWSLHRIWSTDWFERRSQTLAALLEKLDGLVHRQVSEQSKSSLNPTNALSAGERAPESSNRPLANDAIEPDLPNAAVDVGGLNSDPATILAGIVPYQRYSRHGLGTKDTLLAIGPEKLIKVLVDVVAIEGPIHLDELCKVVASLFSARITGATKHRLYTTVDLAVRTGRLTRHGDFLWDIRPHAITPRWRGNDDAVTTAQLICAEEVAAAAVLVAQHSFGIPADDLASATLRALGFKRIGQPLAELGRAAVELALREKRIVADAAGFMVPAESH
ncbi:MAG: hypothetical protein HY288_12805, partial [Planctomycetia bacterium]|nr:hypothetical protein [Planctomycetia bacterium]